MTFDKLVYHEACRPAPGSVLTVDFGGIGELTLKSVPGGEVNWRRLTRPLLDVLQSKLDACDFGTWRDEYSASAADSFHWGLELFDGGKPVRRISGGSTLPEQWPAFRSILELCGALAENRNNRNHRMPNEKQ